LKQVLLGVLVAVVVGPSIIGGSMVGAAVSNTGLFIGAIIGGALAVVAAVRAAVWSGLIAREACLRTAIGGIIGFAVAAVIALLIFEPVPMALSGLFVPLGAVIGSRAGRVG
jgi:hypothetical protein